MKKKTILLVMATLCSGLILTVVSSFSPVPVPDGPSGCTSSTYCPKVYNPTLQEDQWFKNKGLQVPPWYDCCGQECPESEKGKKKVEDEPLG